MRHLVELVPSINSLIIYTLSIYLYIYTIHITLNTTNTMHPLLQPHVLSHENIMYPNVTFHLGINNFNQTYYLHAWGYTTTTLQFTLIWSKAWVLDDCSPQLLPGDIKRSKMRNIILGNVCLSIYEAYLSYSTTTTVDLYQLKSLGPGRLLATFVFCFHHCVHRRCYLVTIII